MCFVVARILEIKQGNLVSDTDLTSISHDISLISFHFYKTVTFFLGDLKYSA